ncbi:MAG: 2,4-dienoyl-CoA reductase-like NADH-dependent reductase (Old Yellow Enzyme family) [Myxococcota bacterium]|jgi:2,4-dienoyl-CoA reductase-like NADH-dependent reductase (Old Yellow Enzyme family)
MRIADPLTLPCGQVVPNRILKSAMSEILGSPSHAPTAAHATLYRRWAEGGVGLSMTGNVMVDERALGEPGNVVVEDDRDLEALTAWAKAGAVHGTRLWMQINHPGKQCPKFLNAETVAPSAVGFGPALAPAFGVPRALEEAEIEGLIERFGNTAAVAKKAGFSGVQVHGAHGYLVSQFLSPHHNRRTDRWGGSLYGRARFVREVYAEIRRRVGPEFAVGIKINSADFQKGGFTEAESAEVITSLAEAGMDLVEVSGGTYEAPAMAGKRLAESTRAREGYFLSFVERVRGDVKVPLAVTGGFRTVAGMEAALSGGAADMVGLARTLAVQPDFPKQALAGENPESAVRRLSTGVKAIDKMSMLDVTWYENQLARMGAGKEPLPELGTWRSLAGTLWAQGSQAFKMRRARG